jgi:hypothetical protein
MSLLWPNTKFDGGPSILQRVALVIWWAALVVVALSIAVLILVMFGSKSSDAFPYILAGLCAVFAWAIGRALFFILSGR